MSDFPIIEVSTDLDQMKSDLSQARPLFLDQINTYAFLIQNKEDLKKAEEGLKDLQGRKENFAKVKEQFEDGFVDLKTVKDSFAEIMSDFESMINQRKAELKSFRDAEKNRLEAFKKEAVESGVQAIESPYAEEFRGDLEQSYFRKSSEKSIEDGIKEIVTSVNTRILRHKTVINTYLTQHGNELVKDVERMALTDSEELLKSKLDLLVSEKEKLRAQIEKEQAKEKQEEFFADTPTKELNPAPAPQQKEPASRRFAHLFPSNNESDATENKAPESTNVPETNTDSVMGGALGAGSERPPAIQPDPAPTALTQEQEWAEFEAVTRNIFSQWRDVRNSLTHVQNIEKAQKVAGTFNQGWKGRNSL